MKSHAKASSAGSNSSRAGGVLGVLLIGLVATACLLPGAAFAADTRVSTESFGPDGTETSSFAFPNALAFDQGNERLYALDQGSASIYGFDASTVGAHSPLGGSFPLAAPGSEPGWVDDLAVDSASHDLYYLSEVMAFLAEPSLYGFDAAGAPLGGNFPVGGFSDPCGAAVDPAGNVWVADYATEAIQKYDSAGTLVETVGSGGNGNPCHVALDSEANLYVSMYGGGVWKYTEASGYTSASNVDPVSGVFPNPTAPITVDRSSDRLYVAHPTQISVFAPNGAFLYEFGSTVAGAEFGGIAVDEERDEVYVADGANSTIHVFGPPFPLPSAFTEDADPVTTTTATLHATVNPQGKALTDCRFEFVPESQFSVDGYASVTPAQQAPCDPAAASIPVDSTSHPVKADLSGLTAGTTYHFRLVAATSEGTSNGPDRIFTTAIGAPTISGQGVATVGVSDVTVRAKVNPKGAKTTYHVEYGTDTSYGQSTAESSPIGFGTDNSDHTVKVHIGGLAAGTAYHFRFVAASAAGSAAGSDTTFATYPTPPAPAPCPNDQFRTGFGSRLPDCRAYEQASPIDKHGSNAGGGVNMVRASSGGDRITFYLNSGLPSSGGSSNFAAYMASRGPGGWSTDGLLPLTEPGEEAELMGWNEELSTTAVIAPGPGNVGRAIYLRDSDTAAYDLAFAGPGGLRESKLADLAADTSHLTFESRAVLVSGAAAGEFNLYEIEDGAVRLPGRIPSGSATSCDDESGPACVPAPTGAFAGSYNWENPTANFGGAESNVYTQNTISDDGSRVFFTARGTGRLYVREDGVRTTEISASQRTVPDPNGQKPAAFMAATADGSTVLFTSCEKLTDDSTAVSNGESRCNTAAQGQDLYSYDVETGELTDLTVDANVGDPRGAGVRGVLGATADMSHVYFAAAGVLATGASPTNCPFLGSTCNLYLAHNGVISFVAEVGGNDRENWLPFYESGSQTQKTSRVAPNGTLLFSSQSVVDLSGNDHGSTCLDFSTPCPQLYRYSPSADELSCVSCNPTGPPGGEPKLQRKTFFLVDLPNSTFTSRNLSADGSRVFFSTTDALLPTDTNGDSACPRDTDGVPSCEDVYEWEANGKGSCETEGGCLYLISTGTSIRPSLLLDISANGDHVFILTSQPLVPGDRDQIYDVYDAGVGAGLSSQHALAEPTCAGAACQVNPAPPPDPPASSALFSGPGNAQRRPAARRCPKGTRKVRRAGKVRCQKPRKQRKRHSNRGGSK